MQGPFKNINRDGTLNPRSLQRNADYLGGLYALDAPDGHTFDQGATGTSLVDQRPKRHLAIIQGGSGSGASGSGVGAGRTGRQIADDMENAYNAKFAQWVVVDDTFEVVEMPDQPEILAIEANGVVDVPDGSVVELLPGPGQPDMYYFWWTGESGTGSGGTPTYTIVCDDGNRFSVDINGTEVTVTPFSGNT